jgi:hypothetical protein
MSRLTLLFFFFGQDSMATESKKLRSAISKWMLANPNFMCTATGCTLKEWYRLGATAAQWRAYCRKMGKPGVHLDQVAMFAMSRLQEKNLLIITNLRSESQPIYIGHSGATQTLRFIYYSEGPGKAGHFEAALPIRTWVWESVIQGTSEPEKLEPQGIISYGKLRSLRLCRELNDEVINRAMDLMGVLHLTFLFMNTFLIAKWRATRSTDVMQRWWRRKTRGAKQPVKVFVPAHMGGNHWVGGVLTNKSGLVESINSIQNDKQHVELTNDLKNIFEPLNKCWPGSPETWMDEPMLSPQQNNRYDCGVFLIAAFDCLCRGKPLAYTAQDVPMLRRRIAQNLYQGKWQDLL